MTTPLSIIQSLITAALSKNAAAPTPPNKNIAIFTEKIISTIFDPGNIHILRDHLDQIDPEKQLTSNNKKDVSIDFVNTYDQENTTVAAINKNKRDTPKTDPNYKYPPSIELTGSWHIEWMYPDIYSKPTPNNHLQIGLGHTRAADDIRIVYESERDGWSIQQASIFEWDIDDQEMNEDWQEVAFVTAWERKEKREQDESNPHTPMTPITYECQQPYCFSTTFHVQYDPERGPKLICTQCGDDIDLDDPFLNKTLPTEFSIEYEWQE